MSVARSASATTSLPKPAALTPAGTGRSNADKSPPSAGRPFLLSLLSLDTFANSAVGRPAGGGRHPTGLRALAQSGEQFQPGIAVDRLHTDLPLKCEDRPDGVAAGAAVDAIGLEPLLIEPPLDFLDLIQGRHAFAAGEL